MCDFVRGAAHRSMYSPFCTGNCDYMSSHTRVYAPVLRRLIHVARVLQCDSILSDPAGLRTCA